MKIGIYKIGKPIYFYENEEDHASWSTEVVNVIKILKQKGHQIWILSDTDYVGNEYHTPKTPYHVNFDKIYVWNGYALDDSWTSVFNLCDEVNLILTDMALTPEGLHRFKNIYTQSNEIHSYGAIETSSLYEIDLSKAFDYKKDIRFYFGGTERGRTWDFLQYVYRPGHLWHGKSASLGIRDYVPFHEHINLLKRTKYTIVIGDKIYNEHGFVTPRYYENLQYGVIPFVDKKYDPNDLVPIHPYLRVGGFVDMYCKMKELDDNNDLRLTILEEAIEMIPEEYKNGDKLYSLII